MSGLAVAGPDLLFLSYQEAAMMNSPDEDRAELRAAVWLFMLAMLLLILIWLDCQQRLIEPVLPDHCQPAQQDTRDYKRLSE